MNATTKIELKIRSNAGRSSIVIPKGATVELEMRGPYVHVIYNDNNFRMPAQVLTNLELHENVA